MKEDDSHGGKPMTSDDKNMDKAEIGHRHGGNNNEDEKVVDKETKTEEKDDSEVGSALSSPTYEDVAADSSGVWGEG